MEHYYYLFVNLFAISVPFIKSFDPKAPYYKEWKALFAGILFAGVVFIAWDVWFTEEGVWGFNPRYLIGVDILGLPIEEWMFFVTVPYASIFIYFVLNYFFPNTTFGKWPRQLAMAQVLIFGAVSIFYTDREYTYWNFILNAIFLLFILIVVNPDWLGRFYRAYAVTLIPFLLVNGVLTGSGLDEPIVWYNDMENLGIRIGTIPIEDIFYGQLLILMGITGMEWVKRRSVPQ